MPELDLATPAGRRAWTRQLLAPIDDTRFDELAQQLLAWQCQRLAALRRLCQAHGVSPSALRSWKDIPAVPQQLFKYTTLFCHPGHKPAAIYETSGTTTGQPGRQHLLSTDIYRTISVEGARRAGFLGLTSPRSQTLSGNALAEATPSPISHPKGMQRAVAGGWSVADLPPVKIIKGARTPAGVAARLEFLAPSPAHAPHSSLSAMFEFWRRDLSPAGKFWLTQRDALVPREKLFAIAAQKEPVGLCGTALAFSNILTDSEPIPLPRGSFLLETGGFKFRSREIPKAELYAELAKKFSISTSAIWNEYGMSELSSQAYARGVNGLHQAPPWTRVLVINPATGHEVAPGQRGLVRWIDLANVDSVLAVQTLDLAIRQRDGFQLIGRLPRTEPRGCSLSIDDLAQKEAA